MEKSKKPYWTGFVIKNVTGGAFFKTRKDAEGFAKKMNRKTGLKYPIEEMSAYADL